MINYLIRNVSSPVIQTPECSFTHVEFNKKSYKCKKLTPLFYQTFLSNPSSQILSTLLTSLYLFDLSFKRLFQLFNDFKQEKSWVWIFIDYYFSYSVKIFSLGCCHQNTKLSISQRWKLFWNPVKAFRIIINITFLTINFAFNITFLTINFILTLPF